MALTAESFDTSGGSPVRDVVAIYTTYINPGTPNFIYNQAAPGARPMKCRVKETAQLMRHPLASGSTFVDHRIINPIEIELSVIFIPQFYQDQYNQLKQLYNSSTLLTVQTKTGIYRNMLISAMPHDEDPDMYDTIAMAITLEEAMIFNTKFGTLPADNTKNKNNSSTVNTGQKQPKSAAIDLINRAQEGLRNYFGNK